MGDKKDLINEQDDSESDVCRDFLRNVCNRGRRCKFRHPPHDDEGKDRTDVIFCHDYQNSVCRRSKCKFIHCSKEEEDRYLVTKQLPPHIQETLNISNGRPICKDYQKGQCERGVKCKYKHIQADTRINNTKNNDTHRNSYYEIDGPKKRRTDYVSYPGFEEFQSISYRMLEEENTVLKRKIEDLKKTVADLRATNEILLDQNARYRVSKTLSGNELSLAPVVSPARAPNAHTLNHVNSTVTQQISLNSDIATQHVLQTAAHLASGGSLGVAPTQITQQTIVPVTIGQNNLSMQTLQTGCTLSRSIPHSYAAAHQSNPLISYPIMSHSMRTPIVAPTSLSH